MTNGPGRLQCWTMAEFLKIEINQRELDRMFADLPKKTKAATANTLNMVARKVNKNLKDEINKTYNVPKSAMKFGKLVSIKRANARDNIGKAIIFIKRQGRGLLKYDAVQTKTGLTVNVKRSSKQIPHGFIAPIKKGSGEKFAFIKATGKLAGTISRVTKKGTTYKAAKRAILWGPQIAQLYTNLRASKVIEKTIEKEFQPELDKQFNRQFEKGR